jgi:hypothetical protein
MIISASRRTDIPAFYTPWLINRIQAGYCSVPNPFNPRVVSYVSLAPQDVAVIVFWTRHPRPLLPHLDELDHLDYRYYFQYTLLDYPRALDPKGPSLPAALDTFRRLSDRVGPDRIIWRYDPIVFSQGTGASFHRHRFAEIVRTLRGHTHRVVISMMDPYKKTDKRLKALVQEGFRVVPYNGEPSPRFEALMRDLAGLARENDMEISSCAEEIDLAPFGIRPRKCVDDAYIARLFGLTVSGAKDRSQRKACNCVVSKDIGMYDSCLFGCRYCYATTDFSRARANWRVHDPESPSLLGHFDADPPEFSTRQGTLPLI